MIKTITYKDWYLNQKRVPDKDSDEYEEFFEFHQGLCKDGFFMEGEYFNPFLYWHLNFWNTEVDVLDEMGRIQQKYANPYFRDNEWVITNEIHRAEKERKGLVILGIRRLAKSVIESSYLGMGATFDANSQNVIAGLNAADIKLVTDKIDKGLNFLPEAWKWQRVEDNWKNQVTLGIKKKDGTRIPFSQIIIRNLDDGNNEEAIAGTKPRKLIIDEIGKGSFLRGLSAAIPGFSTPFGWGCSPILCGCVCKGTKVWTADGRLINIENLVQEDGIIGYSGKGISKEVINWLKPPAKKQCYKITTSGNKSIECSFDHPLLKSSRNEKTSLKGYGNNLFGSSFTRAQDLKIGDYLLEIEEVPIFGDKILRDARFIGLMIGDGYFRGTELCIDDVIIRDYIEANYKTSIKKSFITKAGNLFTSLTISGVQPMLKALGLFHLTKENKDLPTSIAEYDKNSLSEIIAGIFDADGNIYYNERNKTTRIVLTNISIKLLENVRYQLLKFGIHSTIYKEMRNGIPSEEYRGQRDHIYRLYISKHADVKKFRERIPILHSKKVKTLSEASSGISDYTNCKGSFKITGKHSDEEFLENKSFLTGFRYDIITDIQYIGEKDVYNLNTDSTHTYIANGFITHNTGGDMKKFMDAKKIMFDVGAFNFLEYNNEQDSRRVHGLFIGNKYRLEGKEWSTLGKYLNKPEESSFHDIKIQVSNEEKAKAFLENELANKKKSGDRMAYLKEKMYYPLEVDDIFLNEDSNIFDIELLKHQQARLKMSEDNTGFPVELFHDGEKISHKPSKKLPISNFPLKPNEDKDAPIMMYEPPIENPPYGLYCAGIDPYRQGKAKYSDSLGSVYIYKRMHNLVTEKYQEMFVASYTARPNRRETWQEQSRLLIKYYNARALCENDDVSFIDYMISKGDGHLLEDQPKWLKEIVPNTGQDRDKGIGRSSSKVIDFLHSCLKNYSEEKLIVEKDSNGSVVKEVLGVNRIKDPMLLEEMIQYNEDGNFDRLVAAELAIAQAMKLDPILGKMESTTDPRYKALYNKTEFSKPQLFEKRAKSFSPKRQRLFR